ncbi:unnamed protein product [Kuraishia capsulata CBS 1993]|uniref:Uncharacterized protein n=1 Tax=Kuraishia capsulata CBS 1993 TaxID=1382522 RepID=W6MT53_9ASCO|nr:unnamed protein product [Kuraishia capsulata CBS 1993]
MSEPASKVNSCKY